MKKKKKKPPYNNCGGKKRGCHLKTFDMMRAKTFETIKQAA